MSIQTLMKSALNSSNNYNKLDDLTLLSYKFELDKSMSDLKEILNFRNNLLEIKKSNNINLASNYLNNYKLITTENYNIKQELDNNIIYSDIACESLFTDIQDKFSNFIDIITGSYKNTFEIIDELLKNEEEFKNKLSNPETENIVLKRINIYNKVVYDLDPTYCINESSLEGFISASLDRLKFYHDFRKQYGSDIDNLINDLAKGRYVGSLKYIINTIILAILLPTEIFIIAEIATGTLNMKKDINTIKTNLKTREEIHDDEFLRIYQDINKNIEKIHLINYKNIKISSDTCISKLKELKSYLNTVKTVPNIGNPGLVVKTLKTIKDKGIHDKVELLRKALLFYVDSARAQNELVHQLGMLVKEINKI